MNELLAIIIIVLLCCAMFFAWLISMATCPDRMVDLISGNPSQQKSSSCSSPTTSKEIISGSNSPKGKENNPFPNEDVTNINYNDKSKKKYSATFFQLGNTFAQRGIRAQRGVNKIKNSKSNPKKLSVVPEQDEQLTINSKASPAHYSISITYEYKPLLENPKERTNTSIEVPCLQLQKTYDPKMLQIVPFSIYSLAGDKPAERCVEDVIEQRRLQEQKEKQTFSYNEDAVTTSNHDAIDGDTIFLLPPRYELLHATLTSDAVAPIADADSISLPNSPRNSTSDAPVSKINESAQTTFPQNIDFLLSFHSETNISKKGLVSKNSSILKNTTHFHIENQRRHSFQYIV